MSPLTSSKDYLSQTRRARQLRLADIFWFVSGCLCLCAVLSMATAEEMRWKKKL